MNLGTYTGRRVPGAEGLPVNPFPFHRFSSCTLDGPTGGWTFVLPVYHYLRSPSSLAFITVESPPPVANYSCRAAEYLASWSAEWW